MHLSGRTVALAALALLVPVGALAGTGADRTPAGAACVPKDHARLLMANNVAALYIYYKEELQGCTTAMDEVTFIGGTSFYRPPVMALNGTRAATADIDDSGLVIRSIDLRKGEQPFYDVERPDEQLGSLKVRPDGTMAWVSCPFAERGPPGPELGRQPASELPARRPLTQPRPALHAAPRTGAPDRRGPPDRTAVTASQQPFHLVDPRREAQTTALPVAAAHANVSHQLRASPDARRP